MPIRCTDQAPHAIALFRREHFAATVQCLFGGNPLGKGVPQVAVAKALLGIALSILAGMAVALVLAVGSLLTRGLNFGIDFTGGTLIEVGYVEPADLQSVRAALEAGGLLERNKGLALPSLPLRVALVTSADSAAYQDFVSTLGESGYGFRVLLVHAAVQGRAAEGEIASALAVAAGLGADCVALIRGGGSRTDLAVFDSRKVAEDSWAHLAVSGDEIFVRELEAIAAYRRAADLAPHGQAARLASSKSARLFVDVEHAVREAAGEETYVGIISDHGAVADRRIVNIRKFLHEKGFLSVKPSALLPVVVTDSDWKVKAPPPSPYLAASLT